MHDAVRRGDVALLQRLVAARGGDSLDMANDAGITPLHRAVADVQTEMVRVLIAGGASVNVRTQQGVTPLHWAAERNATSIIPLLLAAGAEIDAGARGGITPLHWAALQDSAQAVQMLLEAGAAHDAQTDAGDSPLDLAKRRGDQSESVRLLQRAGTHIPDADALMDDVLREAPEVGRASDPDPAAREDPAHTEQAQVPGDAEGAADQRTLLVGDEISLEVFREREFSGKFRIQQGGIIRHPILGDVELAGLTVAQAERLLTSLLSESFLVNPRVIVTSASVQTSEVLVMGEVRRPGARSIPFQGKASLLEIIAEAGGFTDSASVNRVQVIRQEDGRQQRIRVRVGRIMSGAEPDVDVLPNDVIVVPQTFF